MNLSDPGTERFGDYVLLRRIATGGMGELFLADRAGAAGFSKKLVVKRIRQELADDPSFVEMFLNEGRVAALINHPNVVPILDLGCIDGAYFMAMEHIPGTDLGSLLRRHPGPLDLGLGLSIMIAVCDGLAFAHEAVGDQGQPLELVHRDINPYNVLLSYTGAVKITDFGIAKVKVLQRQETRAGIVKGKFGYLAPEQAQGKPVDRRTDIYALGLLLFELTVGKPAIVQTTDAEMLLAAARGYVRRPSNYIGGYPRTLEEMFLRATALAPEDRFASVRDLQSELVRFQVENRLMVGSNRLGTLVQTLFPQEASTAAGARRAGSSPSGPLRGESRPRPRSPSRPGSTGPGRSPRSGAIRQSNPKSTARAQEAPRQTGQRPDPDRSDRPPPQSGSRPQLGGSGLAHLESDETVALAPHPFSEALAPTIVGVSRRRGDEPDSGGGIDEVETDPRSDRLAITQRDGFRQQNPGLADARTELLRPSLEDEGKTTPPEPTFTPGRAAKASALRRKLRALGGAILVLLLLLGAAGAVKLVVDYHDASGERQAPPVPTPVPTAVGIDDPGPPVGPRGRDAAATDGPQRESGSTDTLRPSDGPSDHHDVKPASLLDSGKRAPKPQPLPPNR